METDHSQNAIGDSDPQSSAKGDKRDQDFVKHSTYMNVLDEAKNAKGKLRDALAELNEFREKEKQLQEQKLLDEKRHVEIIESLKAEKERLLAEVDNHVKDKLDFRKMNAAMAVMQSKGINLESKYFGLLPIDDIAITEDGNIDGTSVASVVENFQKEHPRLTMPSSKLLPNDKSGSQGQQLSIEQWKKLGRVEKQQALKEGRVKSPY